MGEIGENGNIKRDAESTKFGESVRSDFEDEIFGAGIGDFFNAAV